MKLSLNPGVGGILLCLKALLSYVPKRSSPGNRPADDWPDPSICRWGMRLTPGRPAVVL